MLTQIYVDFKYVLKLKFLGTFSTMRLDKLANCAEKRLICSLASNIGSEIEHITLCSRQHMQGSELLASLTEWYNCIWL